ncbi:DNA-binding response regulator [Rhodoplanes elegans]|uniref:DNA-binding response regulator n=1 Tax=Rhodoplanes elegans TaxID=29408 RepID=A0A327KFE7_9BRAD|nr:response regulator transcription factor [Rhodoplanes elegans]MBK5958694.1 DNA-binding response regulator [Rhodoplanes elegans]RAI37509.1 DNA-binding response regulator [Rhodoplanes elegans]
MSGTPAILVVDDDEAVREVLRKGLEAEGFAVREAAGKKSLLEALDAEPIRLITLDLGLGRDDGLSLANEIRARRNLPIVMITARGEPVDRVTGLEHGADDYITKPFHIREVVLRIRTVLRHYTGLQTSPEHDGPTNRRHRFAAGVLDMGRRELRDPAGSALELTDTEIRLLDLFLRCPNRVLSRDEISLAIVGRRWEPLDRTVDGHVARLRRKIEPPGEAPTLIKSVRGVGYVFTGDVTTG